MHLSLSLAKPAITEFNSFRKLSNVLQHHFEHLRYDCRKCDLKRTLNLVQWIICSYSEPLWIDVLDEHDL